MDLHKLKPWNWFRREEQERAQPEVLPARRMDTDPLLRMHQEIDRLFEDFLGRAPQPWSAGAEVLLRPSVDISESRKGYRISVEVPGIDEDAIDLAIDGHDLVISGEKRRESESDDEGFHRVERAYGQFRRVLSLPDDADLDGISARFRRGVLTIEVPRLGNGDRGGWRRIPIGRDK